MAANLCFFADIFQEFCRVNKSTLHHNSGWLILTSQQDKPNGNEISLTTTMQFDYWSKDLIERKFLFIDVIGYHQSVQISKNWQYSFHNCPRNKSEYYYKILIIVFLLNGSHSRQWFFLKWRTLLLDTSFTFSICK